MLKQFAVIVLDTREPYFVNIPLPVLQRETYDASRTTYEEDGRFVYLASADGADMAMTCIPSPR